MHATLTLVTLLTVTQPVPPPALQFDTLTLADAKRLNGTETVIQFRVGLPPYTWLIGDVLHTVTGPTEAEDEQERTVVLRGNRLADLKEGRRIRVVGTLRVLHHKEALVNGVKVPAWDEIRFEER